MSSIRKILSELFSTLRSTPLTPLSAVRFLAFSFNKKNKISKSISLYLRQRRPLRSPSTASLYARRMARVTVPSKNGSDHHPPYAQMIFTAIASLNEKNGSSRTAIAKFIGRAFANLPKTHASLLTTHLRRLKQNGHLIMVKHSYKLPRMPQHPVLADAPHRGRGRPRKPTAVITAPVGPRRGRGRPPKSNPKPILPKRPRGRPRKESAVVAVRSPSRPRGRPPKIDGSVIRPRGRPRKIGAGSSTDPQKKQRVVGDVDTSARRPRGRPPKVARVVAEVEME